MGQFRPLSARRVGARRRGFSTFGLILIILGLVGLLEAADVTMRHRLRAILFVRAASLIERG